MSTKLHKRLRDKILSDEETSETFHPHIGDQETQETLQHDWYSTAYERITGVKNTLHYMSSFSDYI